MPRPRRKVPIDKLIKDREFSSFLFRIAHELKKVDERLNIALDRGCARPSRCRNKSCFHPHDAN
jgi:hypothetical protein